MITNSLENESIFNLYVIRQFIPCCVEAPQAAITASCLHRCHNMSFADLDSGIISFNSVLAQVLWGKSLSLTCFFSVLAVWVYVLLEANREAVVWVYKLVCSRWGLQTGCPVTIKKRVPSTIYPSCTALSLQTHALDAHTDDK